MKIRLPISILIVLLLLQSCSPSVPKVVENTFTEKFIGAEDMVWDEGPDKDWKVSFYMKKFHYMTAYYTSNGKFEAFEIEIYGDDIPVDMADKIFAKYPDGTIYNVFEKNRNRSKDYIFEIENNGKLFGIFFRSDGGFKIIPADDYRFTSRIHFEND